MLFSLNKECSTHHIRLFLAFFILFLAFAWVVFNIYHEIQVVLPGRQGGVDHFLGYRWGIPKERIRTDLLDNKTTRTNPLHDKIGNVELKGSSLFLKDVPIFDVSARVEFRFSPSGGLWRGEIRIPWEGVTNCEGVYRRLRNYVIDEYRLEPDVERFDRPSGMNLCNALKLQEVMALTQWKSPEDRARITLSTGISSSNNLLLLIESAAYYHNVLNSD